MAASDPVPAPDGILDANGIIGLAKADCLSYLPRLFREIFILKSVVKEVTDPVSKPALEQALADWLKPETPTAGSIRQVTLTNSKPDRHVIALALDHNPCVIITGDIGLSNKAKQFPAYRAVPVRLVPNCQVA